MQHQVFCRAGDPLSPGERIPFWEEGLNMVSVPLRDRPLGAWEKLRRVLEYCREPLAVIGAAIRVADAVESRVRPHAEDLRILGIRELPHNW